MQFRRFIDRHQAWCYLIGLGVGAAVGLSVPGVAPMAEITIMPALAVLLYVTFLSIPFNRLTAAFRDWRFMSSTLVLNFLLVPAVVWALSRVVAHDQVLLVGVLAVLLTPCIDYVIVFTDLAKGNAGSLLAAAPVLMVVQMLLLPVYFWFFLGPEFLASIDYAPFVEAFVWIIAVPLALAALTQRVAQRRRWAQLLERGASAVMVPLMMATLGVVVAAHIAGVRDQLSNLLLAVPVYVAFAAIMIPIGMLVGRMARLGVPQQRALVLSGVTRNSLVILPLVLALPTEYELVPLVVVTQTLVELLIMVSMIRLIPRLIYSDKATR